MLLLRTNTRAAGGRDTWTARAHMDADAYEVIRALTDPEAIAGWAPVSFEVEGQAGDRLRAGSSERVTGSIAGIGVAFDVEVQCAHSEALELVARGPVELEVAYRFGYSDRGLVVDAAVTVVPQPGLKAQVLRAAVVALLNAGALDSALRRLEASLPGRVEAELLAA